MRKGLVMAGETMGKKRIVVTKSKPTDPGCHKRVRPAPKGTSHTVMRPTSCEASHTAMRSTSCEASHTAMRSASYETSHTVPGYGLHRDR
jgi:hypothetical protein